MNFVFATAQQFMNDLQSVFCNFKKFKSTKAKHPDNGKHLQLLNIRPRGVMEDGGMWVVQFQNDTKSVSFWKSINIY